MQHFALREFGLIFNEATRSIGKPTLDQCSLPEPAFAALRQSALKRQDAEGRDFLRLRSSYGFECVQVLNFVGVFQLEPYCQLEILPKTSLDSEDPADARRLLWRMLRVVNRLPPVEADRATVSILEESWVEALIRLVLDGIGRLVRRGLTSQYVRRDEETEFLRGRLRTVAQVRQRPGRQHYFQVSYERYLRDRPENRLLKSCLIRLNRWANHFENKRLCRELLFVLDEISESTDVAGDLRSWSTDRSMIHYQSLLPWIRLILADEAPVFARGVHEGTSLLFPMERLFEEYVAIMLKRQLAPGLILKAQAKSEYLIEDHSSRRLFQLQPDLVLMRGRRHLVVLDTKWKLIDASVSSSSGKYELKQSDLYQLFAYGHKYLGGEGNLFLIYPRTPQFRVPLSRFEYQDHLHLWVVPFDLEVGRLVGGEWSAEVEAFPT